MPEGISGAGWAFFWGLAAASGVLIGTILGLIAKLPHRAIAAIMSFGAGVLVSAASISIKIASEALIVAGAVFTAAGIMPVPLCSASRTRLFRPPRIASAAVNASRRSRKRKRQAAASRSRSGQCLMLSRRR